MRDYYNYFLKLSVLAQEPTIPKYKQLIYVCYNIVHLELK